MTANGLSFAWTRARSSAYVNSLRTKPRPVSIKYSYEKLWDQTFSNFISSTFSKGRYLLHSWLNVTGLLSKYIKTNTQTQFFELQRIHLNSYQVGYKTAGCFQQPNLSVWIYKQIKAKLTHTYVMKCRRAYIIPKIGFYLLCNVHNHEKLNNWVRGGGHMHISINFWIRPLSTTDAVL